MMLKEYVVVRSLEPIGMIPPECNFMQDTKIPPPLVFVRSVPTNQCRGAVSKQGIVEQTTNLHGCFLLGEFPLRLFLAAVTQQMFEPGRSMRLT